MELLAPGGDVNSIKAAILAGADAIYCGLDKFNARNRAANINFDDLQGILQLAHQNNCQIFLTLNIIIVESELPALFNLLNKLANTSIDGVIVQDLGLLYLIKKHFKNLCVHASTQLTTHNAGQILFLSHLNASRVNLSRELNIREIKELTKIAHQNQVSTEVFVHGSNCISFSGICYMSSVLSGNSGNRGRCSQPCRERYITTSAGKDYPLNLKDNSAFYDVEKLYSAGVDSLKIEGRIKKFDYVYTVVNTWNKQLQNFYNNGQLNVDNSDLFKVFNRDFSNTFLKGDISKEQFIDNPRDHSIQHLSELNNYSSKAKLEEDQIALYNEKENSKTSIENQINQIHIAKAPLYIKISGKSGTLLNVSVTTPYNTFVVNSEAILMRKSTQALDRSMIMKRFKAFDDTEYQIRELNLDDLENEVFISFNELTSLKNKILFILNGSKEKIASVQVPILNQHSSTNDSPTLSVLISSEREVELCNETSANIYFQLPNSMKTEFDELIVLFQNNNKLIPWFPSILIGEDYTMAVEFLHKLQPQQLVTNNTGIAFEAFKMNISWIAGPQFNLVNSYSLLALHEKFNCSGAFISNEISLNQIKSISKPDNFKLHYSIYHPIVLITSRQCLFHQVTGCEKQYIDDDCIRECEKSSSISNLKRNEFFIDKSKGNYHCIYNQKNFLNTAIVTDLPNRFSSFLIDLRDVKTETKMELSKIETIRLFEKHLQGDTNSTKEIQQRIHPNTTVQYQKGI